MVHRLEVVREMGAPGNMREDWPSFFNDLQLPKVDEHQSTQKRITEICRKQEFAVKKVVNERNKQDHDEALRSQQVQSRGWW